MSDASVRISIDRLYEILVEVRDDVRTLKTHDWLRAEADAKRDKDIDRLKFRVYGVLAGLLALLGGVALKGGALW